PPPSPPDSLPLPLHDALPICSSPSAPRYQLAVLARSGVSRTAMPPSGPHHSRVRCSSRARLRSYSRRAEPPARPRSEGSKVTSRSEEHTSELQSRENLVCRLL